MISKEEIRALNQACLDERVLVDGGGGIEGARERRRLYKTIRRLIRQEMERGHENPPEPPENKREE